MSSSSDGKLLVLPKGIEYQDLQSLLDNNPDVREAMKELAPICQQLSTVDLKLALRKVGIAGDRSTLTFREYIDYAIAPYHSELSEIHQLHEMWINIVMVKYPTSNVSIFAPVDSWKSTIFAVLLPLYVMYLTQDIRVGVFAARDRLAIGRVTQCRSVIETNPKLGELGIRKPARATNWGDSSFTIERKSTVPDPTMCAYSVRKW